MRKITVVKGDEYRAKIERDFSNDSFFAEVYERADAIIKEIVLEMKKYCEENKKRNSYTIRHQGMGNNILLFCAERGQGKTSAMQSFAQFLREGKLAVSEKQDGKPGYYVLDSIDPTALDGKESILRVFLARLFSQYDKALNDEKNIGLDDRSFRLQHEALLELFRQCFVNLDYLKGGAQKDVGQDDLEYLAQMGNSAVLKDNLFKLIDKFFEVLSLLNREASDTEGKYLVVQIDDTDLSAGNIYRMCEDIRNYLSVPNVIIMMAVDYDNLREAVYKKYLEENKIFWHGTDDSGKKSKCADMAAKYMEKVFPSGHRINLPQIDDALSRGEKRIKVSYVDDGKNELLSNEVMALNNLQEQLLLEIYNKTGIVFLKPEEGCHPFLPHTLRQLTHFLKVLSEMQIIDFDLAYGTAGKIESREKASAEIEKLKHNIDVLSGYFTDYWCHNWLNDKERSTIYELIDENRRRDAARLYRVLKNCFGIDGFEKGDNTYQKVIYRVREAEDQISERLEIALELYFTFWLNGWFAEALENKEQYQKIQKYLGASFDFPETVIQKEKNSAEYPGILAFTANIADMESTKMEWRGGNALKWIQWTCEPLDEQGEIMDSVVVRNDSGMHFDETVSKLKFNVLNPVLLSLNWQEDEDITKDNEADDKTSDTAKEEKKREVSEGRKEERSYGIHITAKIIMANTDVQKYLTSQIRNYIGRISRSKKKGELGLMGRYLQIYKEIDSWSERATYLQGEKIVKFKTYARSLMNISVLELLYSSSEQCENAAERYGGEITGALKNVHKDLGEAKKQMERKSFKAYELPKVLQDMISNNVELEDGILRDLKCSKIASVKKVYLKNLLKTYDDLVQKIHDLNGDTIHEEKKAEIIEQIGKCLDEIDKVNRKKVKNDTKTKQTDTAPKPGKP